MRLSILVIGAGGHGRVVADLVVALGRELRGFLDQDQTKHGKTVHGVGVLGGDDYLNNFSVDLITLANAIGMSTSLDPRALAYARLRAAGYVFDSLVHPSAVIAVSASIEAGAQIMASAVVQADAHIGENVIVNTASIVEHDCRIGRHTHIAPGAVLCGNVHVGERCYVGAGSTVIQGVRIGDGAFIAAGSVVVDDVAAAARVAGVPAKAMSRL